MLATMGRVAVCVEKAAWAETAVQESEKGIVRWGEQTSRRLGRRDGILYSSVVSDVVRTVLKSPGPPRPPGIQLEAWRLIAPTM